MRGFARPTTSHISALLGPLPRSVRRHVLDATSLTLGSTEHWPAPGCRWCPAECHMYPPFVQAAAQAHQVTQPKCGVVWIRRVLPGDPAPHVHPQDCRSTSHSGVAALCHPPSGSCCSASENVTFVGAPATPRTFKKSTPGQRLAVRRWCSTVNRQHKPVDSRPVCRTRCPQAPCCTALLQLLTYEPFNSTDQRTSLTCDV